MERLTVYLETSVISYLVSDMSSNLVSLSAINGVDVLLTWNCKHIANIQVERGIKRICEEFGYEPPFICTPLELMGEIKND